MIMRWHRIPRSPLLLLGNLRCLPQRFCNGKGFFCGGRDFSRHCRVRLLAEFEEVSPMPTQITLPAPIFIVEHAEVYDHLTIHMLSTVMVQVTNVRSSRHSTWPNSGTFRTCLYAKTTSTEWASLLSVARLIPSISLVETRFLVFKRMVWISSLLRRQSSMPMNGSSWAKAHFSLSS